MTTRRSLIVDLFAGAGGASLGIALALGRAPDIAINHSPRAIRQHAANHPGTLHMQTDVWEVSPRHACAGQTVALLWASPDCRHFSRAKGGKPVSKRVRSLAWVVCKWAAEVAPTVICLENVSEFQTWGPLGADGQPDPARAGDTFRRFIARLRGLGYAVEWRTLVAADFGAPTIRKRLFLIARRDGRPIVWPQPTHADAWNPAASCIDWTIPCPSIFDRARPLADATCRRIAAGLVRFVLNGKPFIVEIDNRSNGLRAVRDPDRPLSTITRENRHALVTAFLSKYFSSSDGRQSHGVDLREPMATVTAIDHHSLVAAHLVQTGYGERAGQAPRAMSLQRPLGTVVGGACKHALVAAFLTKYYGEGSTAQSLDEPMHTIVQKARFGLVTVPIAGQDYVLADIGLRMLEPRELAAAQGFPSDYQLHGTKAEQIAGIGNSVCPPVAQAIISANLPRQKVKAA